MSAVHAMDAETVSASAGGSQYLTFVLAGEEYGIDILRVQEIRGWTAVTPIPNTPVYVQGVLNLRGIVIPIIDLRQRLGMAKIEYGATTVIVVANVISQGRRCVAGLVVDGVSDVCTVSDDEIKPTPEFGSTVDVQFIDGMAALGEKMVVLLDVDKLLGNGGVAVLDIYGSRDETLVQSMQ
jgi:purine-binding chemotaxis protein CheW